MLKARAQPSSLQVDTVLALVARRGGIAGLYETNVRPAETKAAAFA
jgi:hypothetical protein